jgi:hypothetical protein
MKQDSNSASKRTSSVQTDTEQRSVTPQTAQKRATSTRRAPNTSLPSTEKASTVAPKKQPVKKKVRPLKSIPQAQRSRDEALDEVLDDIILDDENPEEIPVDAPEEIVPGEQKPTNLLERLRQRREKQAEKNLGAMELICKKSGFSEDDLAMLFELGYESELGRLVGYENLKKLKYEQMHRLASEHTKQYRTAFGYLGEDNVTPENKSKIIAAYMHDRKFLILRTLITALLMLIIFLIDVPHLLGDGFAAFDIAHPLLLPILSIVLLIAAATFSYRQLNAGMRSFLKLSPTPYSTLPLILFFTVLYDITALCLQYTLLRVNCIAAGAFLLLSVCDVFRLRNEMRVFRLISADTPKTVLETTEPRKKKLKQGKKLIKIINDDLGESFYHVHTAAQTIGFFRRFNNMRTAHHPFRVLLIIPIALAFCSAFFVSLTADFEQALTTFMAVIALGAPTTACIGYFLPLSHANQLLTHHNAALIGNEAVEEYSESKTVIFNDARFCKAQSCTEISVQQSDDLRKDLRLAGILFRKIGGTLEEIGRATATKAPDPTVAFVRIADTGVEAVIDNQHHIIAGDADFLKRCGVRISREIADRALNHPANVGVLFVAIDGVLKLVYEIEYALNPRFEELAECLADLDTSIAIQSYDPGMNEAFLQNLRLLDAVPVRVIKPGKYESNAILELSDSGAVSLGGEERIVHPLYAAKKAHSATRFALIFQLVATLLGFIAATVSACALHVTLSPLIIGAYHLLCILISTIVTRANINKRTLYLQRQ